MVRAIITFIFPSTMVVQKGTSRTLVSKTVHVKKTGVGVSGFSLKRGLSGVNRVVSQGYQRRVYHRQTGKILYF